MAIAAVPPRLQLGPDEEVGTSAASTTEVVCGTAPAEDDAALVSVGDGGGGRDCHRERGHFFSSFLDLLGLLCAAVLFALARG